MSRVVQFFSEFYNMSVEDILTLQKNIDDNYILNISNDDIKYLLPHFNFENVNLNMAKDTLKKIEEINDKESIGFLTFLDENYPSYLKNIKYFPKILYYKGNVNILGEDIKKIGVVGSRKPTSYGKWVTSTFVSELVNYDFCIVSGFAGGIDSIAHKTAIEKEGKTICVFGTPLNKIYPSYNKNLYKDVLEKDNLIISENHVLRSSQPRFFALRNRIISGLSDSVLITEAGEKSGTLITASYALEQGKTLFAVPGNINSINSMGTNRLIKDGAIMTTDISDILFEYGYEYVENKDEKNVGNLDISYVEGQVLHIVKKMGQCSNEKIAIETGLSIQDIVSVLNILDLKGYISYDGLLAISKLN